MDRGHLKQGVDDLNQPPSTMWSVYRCSSQIGSLEICGAPHFITSTYLCITDKDWYGRWGRILLRLRGGR